jgi:hypothetical protein
MIKDYFNPNAPKRVWQNMWIICGAIATAALVSIAVAQATSEKQAWPEEWSRQSWPTAHYEMSVRTSNEEQAARPGTSFDRKQAATERFVRIQSRAEARETSGAFISQTFSAEGFRGKTIRFSAKTRAQDFVSAGWACCGSLDVYIFDKAGMPIDSDSTPTSGSRTVIEWRDNYMVMKVPTEAQSIVFGLKLVNQGTLDMKDVSIAEVPDGTKITNANLMKGKTLPVKLSRPTNLEFK